MIECAFLLQRLETTRYFMSSVGKRIRSLYFSAASIQVFFLGGSYGKFGHISLGRKIADIGSCPQPLLLAHQINDYESHYNP